MHRGPSSCNTPSRRSRFAYADIAAVVRVTDCGRALEGVLRSSFKILSVLRSNSFGHQPGDQQQSGDLEACEAATIAAMGVPGIGEHECVMTENQRWSIRHREYRTDALIPKVVQMPSLSCSHEVERCVGNPPCVCIPVPDQAISPAQCPFRRVEHVSPASIHLVEHGVLCFGMASTLVVRLSLRVGCRRDTK